VLAGDERSEQDRDRDLHGDDGRSDPARREPLKRRRFARQPGGQGRRGSDAESDRAEPVAHCEVVDEDLRPERREHVRRSCRRDE
jgi:hypothetical protein